MTIAEPAFRQLMATAGCAIPEFIEIEEGGPALLTRFHVAEGAAAALAAGATVAAEIWEMRSGQTQQVQVSTREAAASLVSFLFHDFEDASKAPSGFDSGRSRSPIGGFYPTRDERYVYLHPSFPDSAANLMRLLNCEANKEAVAETVMQWTALDLENAIAEAGVCGAMVRSADEWDRSQQGRMLASLPVVQIVKIADSEPEPFGEHGEQPLSGIRVLDLTRVLAGPTCARTLAQYGAEAMRIGSPNLPSVPSFVADTGHGKLSAFLDLTKSEDAERLRHLISEADVFSQGYRSGALERYGFSAVEVARLRPGMIYTSINCYGHEGKWRGRPGWEQLAQTVTGMADVQGGDATPQLLPCAPTDYTTGYLAAFGSLVALQRRAQYGGSYLVRVSLSQTGMWLRKLGIADPDWLQTVEPLSAEEIDRLTIRSDTGFGPMVHLRPPAQLSLTPTEWRRPVVPLGTHPPVWPSMA
jgi:crotonobetainyl-CoA:carnitine CoA-transferase CaiB-like acyl-CoA transferase|tara:strand:+ start:7547 stop:8959 length:1413 start_codon:yes stop_codon:yes gene_type:complete